MLLVVPRLATSSSSRVSLIRADTQGVHGHPSGQTPSHMIRTSCDWHEPGTYLWQQCAMMLHEPRI